MCMSKCIITHEASTTEGKHQAPKVNGFRVLESMGKVHGPVRTESSPGIWSNSNVDVDVFDDFHKVQLSRQSLISSNSQGILCWLECQWFDQLLQYSWFFCFIFLPPITESMRLGAFVDATTTQQTANSRYVRGELDAVPFFGTGGMVGKEHDHMALG